MFDTTYTWIGTRETKQEHEAIHETKLENGTGMRTEMIQQTRTTKNRDDIQKRELCSITRLIQLTFLFISNAAEEKK